MEQHGILVINKPAGMTSHDVVAKLRRAYGTKKVGHTGTLDPMVEGVMVIAFGKATKLVQFLLEEEKVYRVGIRLGCATDTEDITGKILEEVAITEADSQEIVTAIPAVLASFVGRYQQIPPMYAAIKVNGKKLYEYARAQEVVERTARELTVFTMDYDSTSYRYDAQTQQSNFMFDVKASKGLYARTLCVDIGKKLQVPATMSALTRLASGSYTLEQAIDLDKALTQKPALIAPGDVVLPFERVYVGADVAQKLRQGYKLPHYFVKTQFAADVRFAVYDETDHDLIGIYQQSEKYPDKYTSVRVI